MLIGDRSNSFARARLETGKKLDEDVVIAKFHSICDASAAAFKILLGAYEKGGRPNNLQIISLAGKLEGHIVAILSWSLWSNKFFQK